jgi:hypothetical protein
VKYKVDDWSFVGGFYRDSATLDVPTNTLVTIQNIQTTSQIFDYSASIIYPDAPSASIGLAADEIVDRPVLGPCTVTLRFDASNNSNAAAFALVKYDTVNSAVSPGGVVVQPSGYTADLELQTSTNLTTWNTITNVSYPKAEGNRFFRMSLTLD